MFINYSPFKCLDLNRKTLKMRVLVLTQLAITLCFTVNLAYIFHKYLTFSTSSLWKNEDSSEISPKLMILLNSFHQFTKKPDAWGKVQYTGGENGQWNQIAWVHLQAPSLNCCVIFYISYVDISFGTIVSSFANWGE